MKLNRTGWLLIAAAVVFGQITVRSQTLAKELSLITRQPLGELAVAGRLSIDLHAEFMASRSYGTDSVLNWYNCGYSGGGGENGTVTKVGGNFGDFGFQVPFAEREEKYPHAVTIDKVQTICFDGNDFLKSNFPVEPELQDNGSLAIEVWFRSETGKPGDVILGWQSADGTDSSAALAIPPGFQAADRWRHLVVNCTSNEESCYLDGLKIGSDQRRMKIKEGHRMVLGGVTSGQPSFKGKLVAVRLHDGAMAETEIGHNFRGGPMLGTGMQVWWRTEPEKWWVQESDHFRHCIDKEEMKKWSEQELKDFQQRLPVMFRTAELIYHTYSERLALRSSVVSVKPEERGDGIKYKIPIQPCDGSFMGWDGHFGWACQGAGFINPHELVHGWQGMTGGMQGNFWETHANFPQIYNGIYQIMPIIIADCAACPSSGRTYYHDRGMFEHLAQTPEYGPMFISKLWYDGPTASATSPYPWITFNRINPYPDRPLADEYTRMAMRNVTWDYVTFEESVDNKGNTEFGNDGVVSRSNRYQAAAVALKKDILRNSRIILEKIPYESEWWRVPKEQAPQQLGWNICPLTFKPGRVTATLAGYVNPARGSDWRSGFVGVDAGGNPHYGKIFGPGKSESFTVGPEIKELYLVVCATPGKIMAIDMCGDFRSFEQEQFPYKVKFEGCTPGKVDLTDGEKPPGKNHINGHGFVAATAKVDETAYVGPNAMVLGSSVVTGNARIEDEAVVNNATVADQAVVSGNALVEDGGVVRGRARVRGFAKVTNKSIMEGDAKLLEHACLIFGKTAKDFSTIKGVSACYGNASGTVMLDGYYAKGIDAVRGKWFTWSWVTGKNPGEIDEDFGGLYADYDFEQEHPWMARDSFGATWGYLVNRPVFQKYPKDTRAGCQVLGLNGKDQFVELPRDLADMLCCSYEIEFKWDGKEGERLLEFSNSSGDALWLTPSENGRLVFAIRIGAKKAELTAPAVSRGVWTSVIVNLNGRNASMLVDGKTAAKNSEFDLCPEMIRATECYLGRAGNGGFFTGQIDRFRVYRTCR